MDAQPKIGGFGCFKGVLQIPFSIFSSSRCTCYLTPTTVRAPFYLLSTNTKLLSNTALRTIN
jgi:hypothetical protein